MAVLAVAVVGIIVSVILILICQKRNRKKDIQKALQANQSLLVNGEMPNSPSHSGQSNHGSTNLSYKDGVSTPIKRDYVLAKGTSSHPHSASESSMSPHHHKYLPKSPSGGRQYHSRHSSNSSGMKGSLNSPSSPFRSPVHSPYRSYDPNKAPSLFNTSPLTERAAHNRNSQYVDFSRKKRPSIRSQESADTYVQPTPKSYNPSGAPLAGEEDLSPTSPVRDYSTRQLPLIPSHYRPDGNVRTVAEQIPMDNYRWHSPTIKRKETALHSPSSRHGQRPPVEGRDATIHRRDGTTIPRDGKHGGSSSTSMDLPTTPDYQNANVVNSQGRPVIKPLPLRSVQRPDGQSPENKPEDNRTTATTPSSYSTVSHDLSPFLQNDKLFPTSGSVTPSEFIQDGQEFEYDDYIPDLPGSYFTMDPHQYTLTWSNKAAHNIPPQTTSSSTNTKDRTRESTA